MSVLGSSRCVSFLPYGFPSARRLGLNDDILQYKYFWYLLCQRRLPVAMIYTDF